MQAVDYLLLNSRQDAGGPLDFVLIRDASARTVGFSC